MATLFLRSMAIFILLGNNDDDVLFIICNIIHSFVAIHFSLLPLLENDLKFFFLGLGMKNGHLIWRTTGPYERSKTCVEFIKKVNRIEWTCGYAKSKPIWFHTFRNFVKSPRFMSSNHSCGKIHQMQNFYVKSKFQFHSVEMRTKTRSRFLQKNQHFFRQIHVFTKEVT